MDADDALAEELPTDPVTPDPNDVIAAVCAAHREWQVGETLHFDGGFSWTPHLGTKSGQRVLHVHVSEGMPQYVARRLRAAAAAGRQVYVVVSLTALYQADILEVLADCDAQTYMFEDVTFKDRHYLAAIADLKVATDRGMRTRLGRSAWKRRTEGTSFQKGRRFEALLAFLLAQVADFNVFGRNFRNETQEIDIVVQVDNFSPRCWYAPGVPFILVEAKNRAEAAGQPDVSLLIRKLETKRGTARIGLLFAVAGFSSDARDEELRLSQSNLCVAMFTAEDIVAWIDSTAPDQFLEEHVRRAMLR